MKHLKISIGIFLVLAASRFIPHPPNFTSLIALSFYVPLLLGVKFIPALIICFAITDFFIGFHSTTLFTWGSVILISLLSGYFNKGIISRFSGAFGGACIFFIITNFGVWSLGSYGYSLEGMIACYTLAIPFFAHTIISTMIYACLIESVYKFYKTYYKKFLSF
jgi:hypothetical protein